MSSVNPPPSNPGNSGPYFKATPYRPEQQQRIGRAVRRGAKPVIDYLAAARRDPGRGGGPGVRKALDPIETAGGGQGGAGAVLASAGRGGKAGPPGPSGPAGPPGQGGGPVVVNLPRTGPSQASKQLGVAGSVLEAVPTHEPGEGGGFSSVNRPIVVAVVIIAVVGGLHAHLTGQAVTPVVVGSIILLIFLSLFDLVGGPVSVVASALALLALTVVLVRDLPDILPRLRGVQQGGTPGAGGGENTHLQ